MSSALKAKVKNAANLLQQRKLLQRNLRSLQQHSLSRDILAGTISFVYANEYDFLCLCKWVRFTLSLQMNTISFVSAANGYEFLYLCKWVRIPMSLEMVRFPMSL